jgi:hypothetical protein
MNRVTRVTYADVVDDARPRSTRKYRSNAATRAWAADPGARGSSPGSAFCLFRWVSKGVSPRLVVNPR